MYIERVTGRCIITVCEEILSTTPNEQDAFDTGLWILSTNFKVKKVYVDTLPILPISQDGQTEIPRITKQFRDVFQSHYLIRQCTKILALIWQA